MGMTATEKWIKILPRGRILEEDVERIKKLVYLCRRKRWQNRTMQIVVPLFGKRRSTVEGKDGTAMDENVKQECIRRLGVLRKQGLLTDIDVVAKFEQGELCVSEAQRIMGETVGIIFPVSSKPLYQKALSDMYYDEAILYFLMAQNTTLGMMLTALFVSAHQDEWEMEQQALEAKEPCAYIYNYDTMDTECGFIRYDLFNGGPIRIA